MGDPKFDEQRTFDDPRTRVKPRSWGGLALVMCGICAVETTIAMPRPTAPEILPLPRFDIEALDDIAERELELAKKAMDGHLPNAVRAVGERVRRIGLHIYERTDMDVEEYRALERDVRALLRAGRETEVLELRALQSELFLRATDASLKLGEPTLDLQELGGEFGRVLFLSWVNEHGQSIVPRETLRLMFRSHFARLTGLSEHPRFRQSLQELRLYYSTLIELPPAGPDDVLLASQLRLSYARALGRVDPSYDARPLQAIMLFRLEQYDQASKIFEQYLKDKPNAPFSHLLQGHLQLALLRAQSRHFGAR